MTPVILFRSDNSDTMNKEMETASQHFKVVNYRSEVPSNSLVIGRYSVLPFYRELEQDLKFNQSKLINTTAEHNWIANFEYYNDLKDYTPQSWTEWEFPYSTYEGPFIIKGRTNSRKNQWNTMMYASDRRSAVNIAADLAIDPLIGPQGVIYRQYVPLKTFEIDPVNQQRYTNEWRMFFYKGQLLSSGYYWSSASDETIANAKLADAGLKFGLEMGKKVAHLATFYVIDIAETENNEWIVIELNDGQQAGPSECDINQLYSNLRDCLE